MVYQTCFTNRDIERALFAADINPRETFANEQDTCRANHGSDNRECEHSNYYAVRDAVGTLALFARREYILTHEGGRWYGVPLESATHEEKNEEGALYVSERGEYDGL